MPIDDTYVVPAPVVKFLCEHERSFLALRLIHGLLYALDTSLKGKMSLVPTHFSKVHSMHARTLALAVGPDKAKDNRWIHAACCELANQNILKAPTVRGRRFQFELGNAFTEAFSKPTTAFAIMRTEQVRQCRTLHDLMFLSLACLHGGKNGPRFLLPRIPLRLEPEMPRFSVLPQKPTEQDPWRTSWSASSRAWVNAAMRTSRILDHGYLIAPRRDLVDDFVSEVPVKIQTAKTTWERGKLYRFPAGTRSVIEIPIGGTKSVLNAEALQCKWHQTVIQ